MVVAEFILLLIIGNLTYKQDNRNGSLKVKVLRHLSGLFWIDDLGIQSFRDLES